ncbi:DUF397 domain-containing protein [Streptomyces sp. NL15-2K]|uniref:DUF397 domain-containing protein n=1 Tax=Streptomyces sp. NL15-2K TaxID=376149 RepID=UPI000F575F41|nr:MULTISPECIES: DUF397 domain-containing protein [Actinomycetes]WKX12699.1 DUF397 domain-containing protein [Kutzneria buriramensis]GCB43087.1 hypothetical protein SNL152K_371 [Streptomyces sp. NL15-2K]
MPQLTWQKSSFSGGESEACLYLAAAPDGTLRLRESDAPHQVIATTPARLGHLIRALKAGRSQ